MSKALDFKESIHKERKKFKAQLAELIKEHLGKWVLFKDGEVISFFESQEQAYTEGLKRFGIDIPFLIDQVVEKPPQNTSFSIELGSIYVS
jgi:hypothetical protein